MPQMAKCLNGILIYTLVPQAECDRGVAWFEVKYGKRIRFVSYAGTS